MDVHERMRRMREYYDHRAPWHDDYMSYRGNEAMEALLAPIVSIVAELLAGRSVLEIACGTGNWTEVVAKRAASVLAVDTSLRSLQLAARKLKMSTNVRLVAADAYSLSAFRAKFDAIFAADWYSHVPVSMRPVFHEAVRSVASEGAPVVILDMTMKEAFRNDFTGYDQEGNRISCRELPDGSRFEVIKNFPTAAEIRSAIAEAGTDAQFSVFESLQRWMVTYRVT